MGFIAHVRDTGEQQSLLDHLRGVGDKASKNAAKIGLGAHGELIGLLHDLGKYSETFQAYLKSATNILNQDEDEDFVDADRLKGKIDHSTAGAQLVWRELSDAQKRGPLGPAVGQMLAICIASHHSGLIDCLTSDKQSFGEDAFTRRILKDDSRSHFTEAWGKADSEIRERVETLLAESSLITELEALLRQIIESSPLRSYNSVIAQQQIGLLTRYLFSCLIDADRLDTAMFERPHTRVNRLQGNYAKWTTLIERIEQHLAELSPRTSIDYLRHDISRHCLDGAIRERGIYTLTVPTGGGKTLASLRFALHHAKQHKLERIIYVVPFTSIIDQNAEVARDILDPKETATSGQVVLEHHSNLTPEAQGWREKILTENWDAPVIYTTMVQFLETLFGAGTRGARRMHQLAQSVLIFDEIQSLPIKCVHLFNNAINFLVQHCGSSALLCTATQPLLNSVDTSNGAIRLNINAELIPDHRALFSNLKRVEIINRHKPGGWSQEDVARLAIEEASNAGSCLVIVNTKKAAQNLYRLSRDSCSIPIFHLSTSLCPAHRKEILREVRERLSRRQSLLCVSTQLIEAGVDIDFGAVIRYAAGLDSIAQAAGRCNRNGRNPMGRLHIINPREEDESLNKLIDIQIGRDSANQVLDEYSRDPGKFQNDVIGPDAMERYYRYYFFSRKDDMSYKVPAATLGHDDTLLNLLSCNSLAFTKYRKQRRQDPSLFLRQSFKAAAQAFHAIDAPAQGIIVPHGEVGRQLINELCSAFDVERQYNLLRRAQQFTVNVFPHELAKLQNEQAVYPVQAGTQIFHLASRCYSPEFGLVTEPFGLMETLLS